MISLPQVIISMALFLFCFGIAFILNMLLKGTWLMVVLYPFVIFAIVDKISTAMYFTDPTTAFSKLITGLTHIHTADILMLGSGWIGAIVAGFVIRNLRRSGYSMF